MRGDENDARSATATAMRGRHRSRILVARPIADINHESDGVSRAQTVQKIKKKKLKLEDAQLERLRRAYAAHRLDVIAAKQKGQVLPKPPWSWLAASGGPTGARIHITVDELKGWWKTLHRQM